MLTSLTLALLALAVHADVQRPDGSQKIALTSRKAPRSYASGLRRRKLSPANLPLTDFFKGTDLQWFGNISVGTPPQELTVVFDTGSFTLEFASTQCGSECSGQVQFDASKSSTYVDGGDEQTLDFGTGVGVDPVTSSNEYELTVRSGTDTVSLAGFTATGVSLSTIVKQSKAFNVDPFSGILGMPPSTDGVFGAFVNQGLPALFGMYLTPKATGNAELTLGGYDSSKFTGDLSYAPTTGGEGGNWVLTSSTLAVNGKTTDTLNSQRDIIFDSGTSNVVFDTQTTEAIYAIISSDIKPYSKESGAYGIACDKVASLPAQIDVTFTTASGKAFNLTIPSSELSVGPFPDDSSTCQTLINSSGDSDDELILGGSVLKHYYSVWDVGNQQIGFASNGV
ncbi:acid protease [Amylocystis lapponica]|nr:acid protease [Amylocystis lapponica]